MTVSSSRKIIRRGARLAIQQIERRLRSRRLVIAEVTMAVDHVVDHEFEAGAFAQEPRLQDLPTGRSTLTISIVTDRNPHDKSAVKDRGLATIPPGWLDASGGRPECVSDSMYLEFMYADGSTDTMRGDHCSPWPKALAYRPIEDVYAAFKEAFHQGKDMELDLSDGDSNAPTAVTPVWALLAKKCQPTWSLWHPSRIRIAGAQKDDSK